MLWHHCLNAATVFLKMVRLSCLDGTNSSNFVACFAFCVWPNVPSYMRLSESCNIVDHYRTRFSERINLGFNQLFIQWSMVSLTGRHGRRHSGQQSRPSYWRWERRHRWSCQCSAGHQYTCNRRCQRVYRSRCRLSISLAGGTGHEQSKQQPLHLQIIGSLSSSLSSGIFMPRIVISSAEVGTRLSITKRQTWGTGGQG